MVYSPPAEGDVAGLVAFETDESNYLLGVTLADGKRVVEVVERNGQANGGRPVVLATAPLTSSPSAPVYLKITARGAQYDFSYGVRPGHWTTLVANADGTILSTKLAGGFSSNFVGVMFGMYAYGTAR